MFLVCSYSVTESRTNQKKRHTHKRNLPGRRLGTGSRIVHRDGVVREVRAVYGEQGTPEENKVESIADTEPEFHRRANFHLAAIAEQYRNVETNDVTYAGILAIDLDGAVQQVTWKVGGGPATTQASTNIEHNFAVPSYATRQLRETISLIALRPAPKTKP